MAILRIVYIPIWSLWIKYYVFSVELIFYLCQEPDSFGYPCLDVVSAVWSTLTFGIAIFFIMMGGYAGLIRKEVSGEIELLIL